MTGPVDGCYWIGLSGFGESQLPPPFPYAVTKPPAYVYAACIRRQIVMPTFTRRSCRDANRRRIITSRCRKSRDFHSSNRASEYLSLRHGFTFAGILPLSLASRSSGFIMRRTWKLYSSLPIRRLIATREHLDDRKVPTVFKRGIRNVCLHC